jgi:hypothetical protein
MKIWYLAILLLAFSNLGVSQTTSRGCVANSRNRSIHLCDPAGSTLGKEPEIRAYAQSTSPVTSFQLWMDGVKLTDTADNVNVERATIDQLVAPSREGWHRMVFIARDGIGQFTKVAYYFMTSARACSASVDKEIKICNNLKDGNTVTSPIHIVAATKHSSPIEFFSVYSDIDFNETAERFSVGSDFTKNDLGLSGTIYLPPGTHNITFQGSDGDNDWHKVITVNVVQ